MTINEKNYKNLKMNLNPIPIILTVGTNSFGGGFTADGSNAIFNYAPQMIKDIFQGNVVAVVLNLVLPKENA